MARHAPFRPASSSKFKEGHPVQRREGVEKSATEDWHSPPHPWPLSPLRRGESKHRFNSLAPTGEEGDGSDGGRGGRVRGGVRIFSHLQGCRGGLSLCFCWYLGG